MPLMKGVLRLASQQKLGNFDVYAHVTYEDLS